MLAGMTRYEAVVQYGKERGWGFLKLLGFTTQWGLCKATYSRVFRRIDAADFEGRVGRWIQNWSSQSCGAGMGKRWRRMAALNLRIAVK